MGIISWIIWGLFAGIVAHMLLPDRRPIGLVWTIALGVAGSLIGGFVATGILNIADNDEFDFGSLLFAMGLSVLLLWLYLRYFAERGREPRQHAAGRRL